MGFLHAMTCHTEGIRSIAAVAWRSLDGLCGVVWRAEGRAGATGYYKSPDPRVVIFFDNVADSIRVSDVGAVGTAQQRPLLRAIYVPAGRPLWTRFCADLTFSHLDLHLRSDWLRDRLTPSFGADAAARLMECPAEVQDIAPIAAVGEALKQEIVAPACHPLFAESLALALVTGLLALPAPEAAHVATGGLTPAQMRRLTALVDGDAGSRLTNADLAEAVGLSPSWFSFAFKKTTGKTPQHWQQERRIAAVKQALLTGDMMIADVSTRFGFADQAHLTRVFRRHAATTPAAWLREHRKG